MQQRAYLPVSDRAATLDSMFGSRLGADTAEPDPSRLSDMHRLILEEARTGLAVQATALESLQNRAANLLTSAGLVGAFFGGLAFRNPEATIRPVTVGGVIAFVCVLVCAVYINAPRVWLFSNDPRVMLGPEWDLKQPADDNAGHLARHLGDNYDKHEKVLAKLSKVYLLGSLALVVQVTCLFFDLRGR